MREEKVPEDTILLQFASERLMHRAFYEEELQSLYAE